jgi:K+-sensing histidine kinase KdpD
MILVCVTDQNACDRLIFAGKRLATIEHLDLKVITVRPHHAIEGLSGDSLEYLFSISKQLDAEMIVLFHDYAPEAVANFIRNNDTHYVIVGMPPDPDQSVFIHELESVFPEIPVISIDGDGSLQLVKVQAEAFDV